MWPMNQPTVTAPLQQKVRRPSLERDKLPFVRISTAVRLHIISFTCWKYNVTHFFHGSLQTLNKLQAERSLLLSDIYIKYSMKEFNYNERTLLDFPNSPDNGLFKLKHVACFTLHCEFSTTTWKKKCSSIIRSEAYNVTKNYFFLTGHTLHNCNCTRIALFQH